VIPLEEYQRRERDLEGLCVSCGATVPNVEVDAEDYDCPSCDEPQVQGVMAALDNGHIRIEGAEGGFL
jgi:predicted RNA-binding Zn-ribbon protein involved in translation (DUF1610 family)